MEEILKVTDLKKVYGKRGAATTALNGVSFSLRGGEYVGIMGASGSGKTTLLNCVSTIDRPTSGSILVDGKELSDLRGKELARFRRERLGFIFQDCNLLDTLTAFENIALALSIVRTPAGEIRERCAAARAIVTRPALVLADEPTGALDSRSARMLLERLEELNQIRQTTILMVTHDAFTASCCHRVIFLRDGQIFLELSRGGMDRRAFFAQIIRVVSQLGGEMEDVL